MSLALRCSSHRQEWIEVPGGRRGSDENLHGVLFMLNSLGSQLICCSDLACGVAVQSRTVEHASGPFHLAADRDGSDQFGAGAAPASSFKDCEDFCCGVEGGEFSGEYFGPHPVLGFIQDLTHRRAQCFWGWCTGLEVDADP